MDSLSSPITTVVLSQQFEAKSTFVELDHDLIFDASSVNVDALFVVEYADLINAIATDHCARVLIVKANFLSLFADELLVVPTIREAKDLIEMVRIERDLGF